MYSPVCPGCESCPYIMPTDVEPFKYGNFLINLVRPNHHKVDVYLVPRHVLSSRAETFLENIHNQPVWERFYLWSALGYANEPFLRQHWKENPHLSCKECIEAIGIWRKYKTKSIDNAFTKVYNVFGAHKT